MASVFISHATKEDGQFAHRLADDLQRIGVQVWIAPESIRPGEDFVAAINRGLSRSSHILIVLTPAAVESEWVGMETNAAIALERKGRIQVIPLDVKPCEAPPLLSLYQKVSFRRDYDAGLSQLADILGVRVTVPEALRPFEPEMILEPTPPSPPSELPVVPPASPEAMNVHYQMMIRAITDRQVVPFLGEDVNLCGRPSGMGWRPHQSDYLPSSWELAAYLAETFHYPWNEVQDPARVSQYVTVMLRSSELYDKLHSLFDADYRPPPLHYFFATLPTVLREKSHPHPHQLIVTTNYDDLMERAFQDAGEPFDLVSYVAEGEQRGKFLHWPPEGEARLMEEPSKYPDLSLDQHSVILKIRGTVDRVNAELDSFVITEDHYTDLLTRGDIANRIPLLLLAKVSESHSLFLYGLRGQCRRAILKLLWREQEFRRKSWAVEFNPLEHDRRFWARHDVDVFNVPPEEYIAELNARVQAFLTHPTRD